MRHKNSAAFVSQAVACESIGRLTAQVINDKFSFIERDDSNITRCTVCAWWLRFVRADISRGSARDKHTRLLPWRLPVRARPPQPKACVRLILSFILGRKGVMTKGGEVVSSGMPAVIGAMSTVTELMGSVWDLLTSNPLLTLFVAAGLLPVGIRLFVKLRNAARG